MDSARLSRSRINSVLCIHRSFHQKLPRETSTCSGECTSTWTRCFHLILTTSATTRPRILCSVSALVDSGSSGNFISQAPLTRLNLPRKQAAPGAPSRDHHLGETIVFLVLEGATVDIILGCPWLNQHSPEVRWDPCEVTRWSLTLFTSQLLDLRCFSLHVYSIHLKHSYSLYFFVYV